MGECSGNQGEPDGLLGDGSVPGGGVVNQALAQAHQLEFGCDDGLDAASWCESPHLLVRGNEAK